MITPELANYIADTELIAAQLAMIRTRPFKGTHFEERPPLNKGGLEKYYNGRLRPFGKCPKAMNVLNIEPDGKVRLCVAYGSIIGDARKTGLGLMLAAKKKILGGAMPGGCARCCQRFDIFRNY